MAMVDIAYSVPMLEQGDNPICWIACAAMITSFKDNKIHPISEFTGGADPSNTCIPDPNAGWDDLYRNLREWGFTLDGANVTLTPKVIETTLRRHGPFMIFVFAQDFPFFGPMCLNMNISATDTHAIIVRGINTDYLKVALVNPWGTATPLADAMDIVEAMQEITDAGMYCMAYM
jgi:hypothetical protein